MDLQFEHNIHFADKETLLKELLANAEEKCILILSEDGCRRWGLGQFIGQLEDNSSLVWIKDFASNPSQKDVAAGLRAAAGFEARQIIAVGGGSAIDLAKALYAMWHLRGKEVQEQQVVQSILKKEYDGKKNIEIIAVPTTAGTGSEVTRWATVWDICTRRKYSIEAEYLTPARVYIVPELTLTLPPEIILSTGLDSMCHGAEAYWAKKTNQISKTLALSSIAISVQYLRKALDHPENLRYREKLCLASLLSGLAFSKTRTTACHSISYPLTAGFGVAHGLAAAVTLVPVWERNKQYTDDYEELDTLFKDCGGIKMWLHSVCSGFTELSLSGFGIKYEEICNIAENAFTTGRMDNNPVDFTREDVIEILKEVFVGGKGEKFEDFCQKDG